MASDEKELETTSGGRRGRRPSSKMKSDPNPGLMRVLWADLRKQRLSTSSSPPDPDELAWIEEEEERLRADGAKIGTVRSISAEARENLKRRYWNGS